MYNRLGFPPHRLNANQKLRLINAISSSGLFAAADVFLRHRGRIVFTLHRVLPAEELATCYNQGISIIPESLDALLTFLAKRMPILDLPELLQGAEVSRPSPACAFTFDDGWEDNYRIAFPIFKSHNIPATIFLATDLVGGSQLLPEERISRVLAGPNRGKCVDMFAGYSAAWNSPLSNADKADDAALSRFYKLFPFDEKMKVLDACEEKGTAPARSSFMTWDQVREMQKHRFRFESHTRRHLNLSVNTRELMMTELVGSKEKLQQELGTTSEYFAYPNGMYSDEAAQAVADAGYRAAFTTDFGAISRASDRCRLPRMHLADDVVNGADKRFSGPRGQLLLTRSYLAKRKTFPKPAQKDAIAGKRILFMIDIVYKDHALGGTELQIREIIKTLAAAGAQPQLCITFGEAWEPAASYLGCPVHFARFDQKAGISSIAKAFRLLKWMRSQRFVAIQTFFSESNLYGPVLARLAGIPIVISSRRNLNYWMSPTWGFMQGLANLFVTRIIANAQAVVDSARKTESFVGSKAVVLHNGIDLEKFKRDGSRRVEIRSQLGIADEIMLVGMVSNLRPVKGLHDFIKASRVVAAQYPEARFVIIGEGPLQQELESLIAKCGLTEIFRLLGRQADIPGFLSAFDIAVQSSESEGFSNSVLEYLAAGLPVIATNVGGNSEAIGDAGILVAPRDPAALASAISSLIADSAKRLRLGVAAALRSQIFGLVPTSARLLETYSRILSA